MLVTKQTVRMEHPTEEGAWVDVAVPLTAGDMAAVGDAATDLDFTLQLAGGGDHRMERTGARHT